MPEQDHYHDKGRHWIKLDQTTLDLIDILAERNRRKGHGPTIRAEVVREAVGALFKQVDRALRRHSNAATEAQDVRI